MSKHQAGRWAPEKGELDVDNQMPIVASRQPWHVAFFPFRHGANQIAQRSSEMKYE